MVDFKKEIIKKNISIPFHQSGTLAPSQQIICDCAIKSNGVVKQCTRQRLLANIPIVLDFSLYKTISLTQLSGKCNCFFVNATKLQ